ncbi:MAG: hypothetical protein HKN04_06540 [Rhodothermaceae bacterium]|nr:hypothetical protein [Rhodothermaceae bacterium]
MGALPQHIAELIAQGRKLEAITLIREETGVGLAEAKAAVDQLSRSAPFNPIDAIASEDTKGEVQRRAYEGQTLEAIKLLREETGIGLKEAKALVDQMPVDAQRRTSGSLRLVVAAAVVVLLLGALAALLLSS